MILSVWGFAGNNLALLYAFVVVFGTVVSVIMTILFDSFTEI